ncbi:MAG: 30S ribosomal protein S16 [Candidatus Chisholmbacteria bacterium RIFCSPHIGHO2_12_FULL_49_9]|uniref:Small ribosomal subunit protein bS16 n=1 Tax=Candidatus Chisholmbacteria bacterium RIFCSPHIGHO2_01_FULL_52_32 TaxID=1797591 RepID=A0A1G1VSI8_9BACT|nr:MAG: 30S ribosomal protein S16 [Candidatus Chisholmbacteria bacterium RIFCSPHIGHO2_12_FULL_49_9]OGY18330.1 MAG: 30S ribosomal protein S16 [Candidatus Chisholmbacteria bacterium RIFCSPHIGHO2_01_FULL_52_32]OGY20299.1 MAG: 30S ribosomal protein S16 [Candidatus Chisholmbacteria bacterium RIFCSPLOWO2_01_FULL_50_28]
MLKIKLFPTGKRNQRKYRIVVAVDRSKSNGKYFENLGIYDPLTEPATVRINKERYNAWLKKGAQPTQTVRLLEKKA